MAEKRYVADKYTDFYGILLLGKTGLGKSTTGNKLLQTCDYSIHVRDGNKSSLEKSMSLLRAKQALSHCGDALIAATTKTFGHQLHQNPFGMTASEPQRESVKYLPGTESTEFLEQCNQPQQIKCFQEGTGVESCTRKPCVFSGLRSATAEAIRVIDTPGFADSQEVGKLGVFRANLAMFRDLIRLQRSEKFRIDRALYFLPVRGSLERADGNIQEEIKVMHHFFGNAIFDCMVAVATLHKRKQKSVFDEEDMEETKQAFTKALELVPIAGDRPSCPPIIFIGLDDSGESILHGIKSAPVKSDEGLNLDKFVEGVCTRCAAKYICHAKDPNNSDNRIGVTRITEGGEEMCIPYQSSTCHPLFVPKYSLLKRTAGGAAHVATLGIPMGIQLVRKCSIPWPTFTSKDEICIGCNQSPGSEGCKPVHEKYPANLPQGKVDIYVDHTNLLDA